MVEKLPDVLDGRPSGLALHSFPAAASLFRFWLKQWGETSLGLLIQRVGDLCVVTAVDGRPRRPGSAKEGGESRQLIPLANQFFYTDINNVGQVLAHAGGLHAGPRHHSFRRVVESFYTQVGPHQRHVLAARRTKVVRREAGGNFRKARDA